MKSRDPWMPDFVYDGETDAPSAAGLMTADSRWLHLHALGPEQHAATPTGKYLFFAPVPRRLWLIAVAEVDASRVYAAKMCVYAAPGADYVLCLYDVDNRQAGRLRALYSSEAVQFREWKSDAATRAAPAWPVVVPLAS